MSNSNNYQTCNLCEKRFSPSTNLERHKEMVHYKLGRSEKCDICDKKFSNKTNLKRHVMSVHREIPIKTLFPHFSEKNNGGNRETLTTMNEN